MTRVSVIIPTFNRLRDLHIVLDALARQSFRDFEVLLVDNGSTDGTEDAMSARAAKVDGPFLLRYFRISPSGPAGARNVGIAEAAGELLCFVDSDVALAPDWLVLTVAALDADPTLCAVGGKVIYANDSSYLNAYGGCLSRIGLAWDACEGAPVDSVTEPAERLWMNCSAMLVRGAAVRAVGGFDDRFFYGFEDSDLGWRLSIAGGVQRVLPNAQVMHHVGDEIGTAADTLIYHGAKNRLASLIANAGGGMLLRYLPVYLAYAIADLVVRGRARPKLRALWWNIANLRGTLRRRFEINALRRRSDADLSPLYAPTLFPEVRLNGMRRRPNRSQSVTTSGKQDDRMASLK